ncbi:MAG: hypothetical protein RBT63_07620 [Bdellovibrionales bacterium]|jgi:hypothetical protein|nr:hypothetical protein [Bdellovibrionales bacterium]
MDALNHLRYIVLPARPTLDMTNIELHDHVFQYWTQLWDKLLASLDGTQSCPGDFFRQDHIGVLCYFDPTLPPNKPRILALHTATHFNLNSEVARKHPYFTKNYESDFVDLLMFQGVRHNMSIEYFTVDPIVRRFSTLQGQQANNLSLIDQKILAVVKDLSIAHMIVGLAFQLAKSANADSITAACRVDLKVDILAQQFGTTARETRMLHGVPVKSNYALQRQFKQGDRALEAQLVKDIFSETINSDTNQPKRAAA